MEMPFYGVPRLNAKIETPRLQSESQTGAQTAEIVEAANSLYQVWSTYITYMDVFHCVETLRMTVDSYGKPEIFNSNQGSQFTSSEFVAELRAHGILISMGRRIDAVIASSSAVSRTAIRHDAGRGTSSAYFYTDFIMGKDLGRG